MIKNAYVWVSVVCECVLCSITMEKVQPNVPNFLSFFFFQAVASSFSCDILEGVTVSWRVGQWQFGDPPSNGMLSSWCSICEQLVGRGRRRRTADTVLAEWEPRHACSRGKAYFFFYLPIYIFFFQSGWYKSEFGLLFFFYCCTTFLIARSTFIIKS